MTVVDACPRLAASPRGRADAAIHAALVESPARARVALGALAAQAAGCLVLLVMAADAEDAALGRRYSLYLPPVAHFLASDVPPELADVQALLRDPLPEATLVVVQLDDLRERLWSHHGRELLPEEDVG